MDARNPIGNRQPESHPAGVAVARISHSIERSKNVRELSVGHPGPAVRYADDCLPPAITVPAFKMDFDRSASRRIANGVSDNVLCCAAEQIPIRVDVAFAVTHQIDSAREAADILFNEAGATAIFRNNPFERRFRDIRTVSIQVQGSIARMQSAGQFYLGLTPQQLVLVP